MTEPTRLSKGHFEEPGNMLNQNIGMTMPNPRIKDKHSMGLEDMFMPALTLKHLA